MSEKLPKIEVKEKVNGSDKMLDGLKSQLHTCKHWQIARPIRIISKWWFNHLCAPFSRKNLVLREFFISFLRLWEKTFLFLFYFMLIQFPRSRMDGREICFNVYFVCNFSKYMNLIWILFVMTHLQWAYPKILNLLHNWLSQKRYQLGF